MNQNLLRIIRYGIAIVAIFLTGWFAGGGGRESEDGDRNPKASENRFNSSNRSSSTAPKPGLSSLTPRTDSFPALSEDIEVERILGVLRNRNPADRLTDWGNLLREVRTPADIAVIEEALLDWFHAGGGNIDDESKIFRFRQGQIMGLAALEDKVPTDANGKLHINQVRGMRGWANANPTEARAWIDSELHEGSVKKALTEAWFEGAIASNSARAEELFDTLPPDMKEGALRSVVDALFKSDGLDGVSEWFARSTSAESGDGFPASAAFGHLAWRLAQEPGAGAAFKMLRDPANAPHLSENAFNGATRNVARHDPGRVIDLLGKLAGQNESFGEGTVRRLVQTTVNNASATTINNLGNWLIENPDHELADMTTRYFVEQAKKEDPIAAAEWIGQITDPDLRAEAEALVAR